MEQNNQKSPTLLKAEHIINKHVLWAMAAASMPLPYIDGLAVMFIQNDMLKQLCKLYDYDYNANIGKSIVSTLIASSTAKGISYLFKNSRGADRLVMTVTSGAFTYALGRFFISFFEKGVALIDIDLRAGEELFSEFFEKGKEVAQDKMKE